MTQRLSQNQKTFNKVARHLLKQNQKCKVKSSCLYRGPNGLRWGIGALIPNRLYRKTMEGSGAANYPVSETLQELGHSPNFCADLQTIHDIYSPDKWQTKLEEFAKEYNLTLPII